MPYLAEKFEYNCFKETLEQVDRQYNAMPEAFKGHFTTNEEGEIVSLREPEEVKRMMNEFWQKDQKER